MWKLQSCWWNELKEELWFPDPRTIPENCWKGSAVQNYFPDRKYFLNVSLWIDKKKSPNFFNMEMNNYD